ncbi:hypothetical protein DFS33DRAFT_1324864 [Desarmillaria ectypa]|nr:hypothetical protein DFS33DRAFT_1324864 [Desarmillaria ectypa]
MKYMFLLYLNYFVSVALVPYLLPASAELMVQYIPRILPPYQTSDTRVNSFNFPVCRAPPIMIEPAALLSRNRISLSSTVRYLSTSRIYPHSAYLSSSLHFPRTRYNINMSFPILTGHLKNLHLQYLIVSWSRPARVQFHQGHCRLVQCPRCSEQWINHRFSLTRNFDYLPSTLSLSTNTTISGWH